MPWTWVHRRILQKFSLQYLQLIIEIQSKTHNQIFSYIYIYACATYMSICSINISGFCSYVWICSIIRNNLEIKIFSNSDWSCDQGLETLNQLSETKGSWLNSQCRLYSQTLSQNIINYYFYILHFNTLLIKYKFSSQVKSEFIPYGHLYSH